MVVSYEGLREQTASGLRKILDFLGVAVDDENVRRAVEASSVKAMRKDYGEAVSTQIKAGSFLGSAFAKPYSMGCRFIGRLHTDAEKSVLNEAQRRLADTRFGGVWERVRNLSIR